MIGAIFDIIAYIDTAKQAAPFCWTACGNRGVKHMIRVLIAEDDPQCFQQMEQFIRDYSGETGRAFQITHYDNGEDLVERYQPEFDLLLLDVDMPFVDGMTAAGCIRKIDPEVVIVFVTNLAQYAIQGYSVNALDYILKPLNYFSFSQRLTRCLRYVKKREDAYLTVAVKGGALKLEIRDIYYLERLGHQLMLHTRDGIHASSATLQQMEELLEDKGFLRCNKGYLVNLAHVQGIQDGCAVVRGDKLLISRGRRAPFLDALADYVGGISG